MDGWFDEVSPKMDGWLIAEIVSQGKLVTISPTFKEEQFTCRVITPRVCFKRDDPQVVDFFRGAVLDLVSALPDEQVSITPLQLHCEFAGEDAEACLFVHLLSEELI